MIIKVRNKRLWEVKSHRTGRIMGTYPSRKKALARLRQIKFFGKKKWRKNGKLNVKER